jgi:dTDP-4-dehydrorhamnose reductase
MQFLLLGAAGQLGSYLRDSLAPLGAVTALDRADLDLTDLDALAARIRQLRPQVIINAAAYTAVDRAESEPVLAHVLNAAAPAAMATAAKACGALLVHYSTDYVFDGSARAPYDEQSPTAPLGVYGRTKLAGEAAVRTSGCDHLILRTAWLYSNHGHNFLKTMLRLSAERTELRVVADQFGCPTYARPVAEVTAAMLKQLFSGPTGSGPLGTFHLVCGGQTSWHGFAERIMALAGRSVRVTPITTAEYPTPARRPQWSVLSGEKLARDYGLRLPPWEEALRRCLADGGLLGPEALQ